MAFRTVTDGHNNFKFETVGDVLEGVYVSHGTTIIEDKEVKTYQFKTDNGIKSILGTYKLDRGMQDVPLNTLTRITYTGNEKRKSGGGSVKIFLIECEEAAVSAAS